MNKNINYLIIMRIWAAAILAACCYWIFSDLEIEFKSLLLLPKFFVPWIYFYGTTLYKVKKITVLLVPLLMNIALWIPCYRSYIFIRLVLYAERIAAILWILFSFAWIVIDTLYSSKDSNTIYIVLIFLGCTFFNELMIVNFKKEEYKEKFSANFKTEQEILTSVGTIVLAFYITILSLLMGETILQKKFSPDSPQRKTKKLIVQGGFDHGNDKMIIGFQSTLPNIATDKNTYTE